MYKETKYNISLDNLLYILFEKSLKKIASKLESLSPTSTSGTQYSFRTNYKDQVCRCNKNLVPEQWHWMRPNGVLRPLKRTLEPASDLIMQLISCVCKRNCSTQQCTCQKSGVKRSAIWKVCEDTTCQNHNYEDSPLSRNDKDTHVINLHQVDDNTDSDMSMIKLIEGILHHDSYSNNAFCTYLLAIFFVSKC